MTFSSRVHESPVQFVDPVQTEAASRTTYLWCIRSGTPGIAAVGKGSASSASGSVIGGGGTGDVLRVVEVVGEADGDAALLRVAERAADDRRRGPAAG